MGGNNDGTVATDALKEYLSRYIDNIDIEEVYNPSFDELKKELYQFYREPVPVRILGGEHSVLAVSYYEVGGSKYVGIWRNWYYDKSDPNYSNQSDVSGVHHSNSLNNILYFNYEDRDNWNESDLFCCFIKNAKANNLKELHHENVNAKKMTVKCYVPYGTTSVYFRTWTAENGQDDVVWHRGDVKYGTVAECEIDFSSHNKESGTYITDVYAYENNRRCAKVSSIKKYIRTEIKGQITDPIGVSGYYVTCKLPSGTTSVKFPTWTEENGQDDIIWYNGTISGSTGIVAIDFANHNNSSGRYITHIYAYDKDNKILDCNSISFYVNKRDSITNMRLNNAETGSIVCSCYAPIGTSYVNSEIMAISLGRLGHKLVKINVTNASGYVKFNIKKEDFYNAAGRYIVRINAYNSKGKNIGECVQMSADMK